jgi:hypothetical protein
VQVLMRKDTVCGQGHGHKIGTTQGKLVSVLVVAVAAGAGGDFSGWGMVIGDSFG